MSTWGAGAMRLVASTAVPMAFSCPCRSWSRAGDTAQLRQCQCVSQVSQNRGSMVNFVVALLRPEHGGYEDRAQPISSACTRSNCGWINSPITAAMVCSLVAAATVVARSSPGWMAP